MPARRKKRSFKGKVCCNSGRGFCRNLRHILRAKEHGGIKSPDFSNNVSLGILFPCRAHDRLSLCCKRAAAHGFSYSERTQRKTRTALCSIYILWHRQDIIICGYWRIVRAFKPFTIIHSNIKRRNSHWQDFSLYYLGLEMLDVMPALRKNANRAACLYQ